MLGSMRRNFELAYDDQRVVRRERRLVAREREGQDGTAIGRFAVTTKGRISLRMNNETMSS